MQSNCLLFLQLSSNNALDWFFGVHLPKLGVTRADPRQEDVPYGGKGQFTCVASLISYVIPYLWIHIHFTILSLHSS